MAGMYDRVLEATEYLKEQIGERKPKIGIILGTGLSNLGDHLSDVSAHAYGTIPNFPISTVESHKGQLLFGRLNGEEVVIMQGRFHYYEGYEMSEVTFPIRVMKALGVTSLIISNAAGGLHPNFKSGDIIAVEDHINYQPENPLRGINDARLGDRFPDMTDAYSPSLIIGVERIGGENGISIKRGVYLGLQGPNLETQAELRFFRTIGADLVGMSTVPEVIVARQCKMDVLALSIVTNECLPEKGPVLKTTIESVVKMANETEPKLTKLVTQIVKFISQSHINHREV